jgi:hypothetical protein
MYIGTNIKAEGLLDGFSYRTDMTAVQTRSDSTYSISASNPFLNVFDGTASNNAIRLPDATSLQNGHEFFLANDSTSNLLPIINNAGSSLIFMYPKTRSHFLLKNNSTSAGIWVYDSLSAGGGGAAGYSFFGFYGGNANSGRYLEIYPGTDSSGSPYIVVGSFAISALTLGTSALNTGTVAVYKMSDLVNPLASISLSNENRKVFTGLFARIPSGESLSIKVSSGTLNKPYLTVYLTYAG